MNILEFRNPSKIPSFNKQKKGHVINLSPVQKNPIKKIEEKNIATTTDRRSQEKREEEVGRQLILYGSYCMSFILVVSLIVSYFVYTPRWSKAYILETHNDYKDLDRSLEKLKTNIIQNFHEDLLTEHAGITENNQYILDNAHVIANELQETARSMCHTEPKYFFIANTLESEVNTYCSQVVKLARSYDELLNYYEEMLVLRQELWFVFDSIPDFDGSAPAELSQLSDQYRQKANEFTLVAQKFIELGSNSQHEGTNEINISFAQGWAQDMKATASVLDNLSKTISNEDSLTEISAINSEMDDITEDFEKRILEFEDGNTINEKMIRDVYIDKIKIIKENSSKLRALYNKYELKYDISY